MRKVLFIMGILAVMGLLVQPAHAQLSIDTTPTSGDLVDNILGTGITVSNINFIGASQAAGTFTGGLGAGIGIDSGIILTSGNAALAVGPNTQDGAGENLGLPGDSDLDALIPGYTTNDVTNLQFDFVSDGGDLYFNYVFASEEYNEYVGSSFNDVFGFFVDDVNIALIPGTSTSVAINNVNNGANSAYYNDNDPSDTSTPYNIEYDGFTDVFTAQILGLSAGTHHIKLAIGDAGDHILDSAVFIQASSFSDIPTDPVIPEPATMLLFGCGMMGLARMRKKTRS